MPATDQTYYNQKSLHRVFAVASVLLLAATVWVLVVDHRRPWKQIQRTSDRLETQVTRWRQLQALTEDVVNERERLAQNLAEEQSQELPGALLAVLRDEIRQDAARRAEAAPSFDALDEAVEQLTAAAAQAQEARRVWQAARLQADKARLDADDAAARARAAAGSEGESLERGGPVLQAALEQTRRAEAEALAARREAEAAVLPRRQAALAALQGWVDQARFREDTLRRQGRFERAELDAARSAYGLAVSAGRSAATLQQLQTQIDRRQAELDRLTRAGDAAAVDGQHVGEDLVVEALEQLGPVALLVDVEVGVDDQHVLHAALGELAAGVLEQLAVAQLAREADVGVLGTGRDRAVARAGRPARAAHRPVSASGGPLPQARHIDSSKVSRPAASSSAQAAIAASVAPSSRPG